MLDLHPEIALPLMRVHEACGPSRRTFAMWLAGQICGQTCEQTRGVIMWISPLWGADQPNPDGICAFADPARFIFVAPRRGEDLLWCVEEVLRAGAVSLVVADLPAPPALTPVRRLHLAAETGAAHGGQGVCTLGLLLTPGDGGAQGAETRWHMAPQHQGEARQWQLQRRRARALVPKTWRASQSRPRAGLDLVSL